MNDLIVHHTYQKLGGEPIIGGESDFRHLTYAQRKIFVAHRLMQMLGVTPDQVDWSKIKFAPDREDAIISEFVHSRQTKD